MLGLSCIVECKSTKSGRFREFTQGERLEVEIDKSECQETVNPLSPDSDQDLISPYNMTA